MEQVIIKKRQIGIGRPLICVPVMETKREAIIQEITYLANSVADMVEWRVDAYEDFLNYNAVREILETVKPVLGNKMFLYTFRTKKQGGIAAADTDVLNDLHDLAAESKCVDLVDMEFFEEEHPMRKIKKLRSKGVKVIASHHDFEGTPASEVMQMLLERMCAGGADIVKLAVMPENAEDVLRLLEVTGKFKQENPDTPIITMAMGSVGSVSRLCGETFGSSVTFGAHKKSSAPGQFEMNDLSEILEIIHKSNINEM